MSHDRAATTVVREQFREPVEPGQIPGPLAEFNIQTPRVRPIRLACDLISFDQTDDGWFQLCNLTFDPSAFSFILLSRRAVNRRATYLDCEDLCPQ